MREQSIRRVNDITDNYYSSLIFPFRMSDNFHDNFITIVFQRIYMSEK